MMRLMYDLPSDETAETVTITRDFIKGIGDPIITHRMPALPSSEDAVPLKIEIDALLDESHADDSEE